MYEVMEYTIMSDVYDEYIDMHPVLEGGGFGKKKKGKGAIEKIKNTIRRIFKAIADMFRAIKNRFMKLLGIKPKKGLTPEQKAKVAKGVKIVLGVTAAAVPPIILAKKLKNERASFNNQKSEMQATIDAQNSTISALNSSIDKANNTVSKLEADAKTRQSEIDKANNTVSKLEADAKTLQSEISRLEDINETLKKNESVLKSKDSAINHLNQQKKETTKQLQDARNQINVLENRLSSMTKRKKELEHDLAVTKNSSQANSDRAVKLEQELSKVSNEVSELKGQISELSSENSSLRTDNKNLQAANDEIEAKASGALKKAIGAIERRDENARHQAEINNRVITKLKQELQASEKGYEELRKIISSLGSERQKELRELNRYKVRCDSLKKELDRVEASDTKKIAELNSELESLNNVTLKLAHGVNELSGQRDQLSRENEQLKKDNKGYLGALHKAEQDKWRRAAAQQGQSGSDTNIGAAIANIAGSQATQAINQCTSVADDLAKTVDVSDPRAVDTANKLRNFTSKVCSILTMTIWERKPSGNASQAGSVRISQPQSFEDFERAERQKKADEYVRTHMNSRSLSDGSAYAYEAFST